MGLIKKKQENDLIFDKKKHQYYDNKGNELHSVTRIINKFTPRFDLDGEIAKRVAKKKGISVEEIKKEWQAGATKASVKGTKIHKALELYINSGKETKTQIEILKSFDALKLPGKNMAEKKVFNIEKKIAGTLDLKNISRGKTNVFDFKTNKAINFVSKWDIKMKRPLEYMDDCEYNRYSLQLSLYSWMLEKDGEDIGRIGILWIKDNKIELIPTIYMKSTVEMLLDYIEKNALF